MQFSWTALHALLDFMFTHAGLVLTEEAMNNIKAAVDLELTRAPREEGKND
jgi:hypothetical protein